MAAIERAEARPPHKDRKFANTHVTLDQALPALRISLRVSAGNLTKLAKPLGLKLPETPKSSTTEGSRSALWLGPDEWLLIDDDATIAAALVTKLGKFDCSAVDVSQRNSAIVVSGGGVENLLNSGCPQDVSLAAFPVGACSRTIFGKIEIVLWRLSKTSFRVEVWRSFSDYLWNYLLDAAKDAGN